MKKRLPSRRTAVRLATKLPAPAMKTVPNEIAVRYRAGQEQQVREALSRFGSVRAYPVKRMIVLHRAPGSASAAVKSALENLQGTGDVEFVTPVLLDPDSNARQVLTDEIVVRLKPGRTTRTLDALQAEHGIEIGSRNEFEPSQYIVKVPKPSGTQTLDVARSIDQSDDVEFASPNYLTEVKR